MSASDAAVPADNGTEIPLHRINTTICNLCLTGAGGECHVPGCMFWMHDAPTGTTLYALVNAVETTAIVAPATTDDVQPPPRNIQSFGDWAVTRSVGALLEWNGRRWRWDGHDWQPVAASVPTPTEEDDRDHEH